ncbi:hypothetical protein EVA_18961 [gut metagenome]|uniref:Uncharacterized protein n=1 Tax=gut metagenome TaxID=749906 RepID=J9FDE4_9ZZZZ
MRSGHFFAKEESESTKNLPESTKGLPERRKELPERRKELRAIQTTNHTLLNTIPI